MMIVPPRRLVRSITSSRASADAVLACSWNCLAVLAAQRAGSTADAAVRIVAERERQITAEGWSPEHDEQHAKGELARAGVAYARRHAGVAPPDEGLGTALGYLGQGSNDRLPADWPWDAEWWKPRALQPDLIRAGALLAAELDADRRRHPDPDPVRF